MLVPRVHVIKMGNGGVGALGNLAAYNSGVPINSPDLATGDFVVFKGYLAKNAIAAVVPGAIVSAGFVYAKIGPVPDGVRLPAS